MKYFKATYKVKNKTLKPWIDNGVISWEAPDSDGDYYGAVDGDLPSAQSIHNVTSQDIHSVVVTEISEEDFIAAGYVVQ